MMSIETDNFPRPGDKATALLGPDYAPHERREVTILRRQPLDCWLCQDKDGNQLLMRTEKLRKL